MQGKRSKPNEAEFVEFEPNFSQIEDHASLLECKTGDEEGFTNLLIFHSNSSFCDVLVVVADQEKIDLFLSNVCEEESNIQI